MNFLARFLCFFGIHGPKIFGDGTHIRSKYIGPRLRQCSQCQRTWMDQSRDSFTGGPQWRQI